jgi:uncharacterized protein (TIGR02271 family)
MNERSTVVGVFENRDQVQCAEQALRNAGFRDDQIGIAMRNGDETGTATKKEHGSKAAEGAMGGLVTGGVIGGILGAAAAMLVPGVGPVLAGGILSSALAGAATGAVAGGLLGTLVGMGVPEEEARYYNEEFERGRIIMTAKVDNRYDEAYNILRDCGAYDMETRPGTHMSATASESYGHDRPEMKTEEPWDTRMGTKETDEDAIRLREERLNVNKERRPAGEVDIRKEVVTDTQHLEVPVEREEVVIERKSLGNQPSSGQVGEDTQIRIPVSEEQVNVEKETVDTEEVRAQKRIATDTKHVEEDVKREEVRVDRSGDANLRGRKDITDDRDRDTTR